MPTPMMRRDWITWIASGATLAILAAVIAPDWDRMIDRLGAIELHAPDWALWASVSWIIQVHVYAALSAFLIGLVLLLRPKGRGVHKALGWSWVAAMAITAVSSLFITTLNDGALSLVHLFSGWTVIALPAGVAAIRGRNVLRHGRIMTSMFVGGLAVAGALAFLPGRIMFELFFG